MIPNLYLHAAIGALVGAVAFYGGSQLEHGRHVAREAVMQSAFNKTVQDVRDKTAKAKLDDLANARAVEAAQEQKRKESANAYETELAAARGSLAAYIERLRAATRTNSGGGGGADMPGTPQPAGSATSAGDATLVADLETCTVNTVKAEQWQAWWRSVEVR